MYRIRIQTCTRVHRRKIRRIGKPLKRATDVLVDAPLQQNRARGSSKFPGAPVAVGADNAAHSCSSAAERRTQGLPDCLCPQEAGACTRPGSPAGVTGGTHVFASRLVRVAFTRLPPRHRPAGRPLIHSTIPRL